MLTVTTQNLGPAKVSPADVEDMIRDHLERSDLVNVQEAGRKARRRVLRKIRPRRVGRHPGPVATAARHATSILWDPDSVRVTRRRSRRLNARTYIGKAGAGGRFAVSRYVNHVRAVEVDTGTTTHVLNAHLVPSTGRPGLPPAVRRRRVKLYRRQVRNIARELDTIPRGARVVLTLDANASPWDEDLAPLRRRGLRPVFTGPTKGRRKIDHVWIRGVDVLEARTLDTASDHRAVRVTVR